VDKADLVARWKAAIEAGGAELHSLSQVIPNAIHDVSGEAEEQRHSRQVVLRKAVLTYLDDVLKAMIQQGVAGLKL
jgi:hypothetical protein